jgi:Rrf2 family protein
VRLSAKALYGCVAMCELALQQRLGHPVQVKAIAERHSISPRFLVQILIQLKAAKLVVSSRGASGGYVLARAPDTITLAEVIHSVDPIPQDISALKELASSPLSELLQQIWRETADAERRVLQGITLADLAARIQGQDLFSYQI